MTTQTSNYTFMDLLKDHNYVPRIETSEYDIFKNVIETYEKITSSFTVTTDDYNFMHLLKDNGYGFTPIQVPANDNVTQLSKVA